MFAIAYAIRGQKPTFFEKESDFYVVHVTKKDPYVKIREIRQQFEVNPELLGILDLNKGTTASGYLSRINSGIRAQIQPRIPNLHELEEAYLLISGPCSKTTIEGLLQDHKFDLNQE